MLGLVGVAMVSSFIGYDNDGRIQTLPAMVNPDRHGHDRANPANTATSTDKRLSGRCEPKILHHIHRRKADMTTLVDVRSLAASPARTGAYGLWLSTPTRDETTHMRNLTISTRHPLVLSHLRL
jgi:hypothetical protein